MQDLPYPCEFLVEAAESPLSHGKYSQAVRALLRTAHAMSDIAATACDVEVTPSEELREVLWMLTDFLRAAGELHQRWADDNLTHIKETSNATS